MLFFIYREENSSAYRHLPLKIREDPHNMIIVDIKVCNYLLTSTILYKNHSN